MDHDVDQLAASVVCGCLLTYLFYHTIGVAILRTTSFEIPPGVLHVISL